MSAAFLILLALLRFIPAPPAFSTFGNNVVGDCLYATEANLTVAEFPQAQITTAEVVGAYDEYGAGYTGTEWSGQWYLLNVGFDGYLASSITTIAESDVLEAANAGGVEVDVWQPGALTSHEIAIVGATPIGLSIVNSWYGVEQTFTWAQWNAQYPAPAWELTYAAVTWET